MTREHYPERIPFRLTRMLIAAMEVSGIEGNYRSTCDSVMKVLREVRVWSRCLAVARPQSALVEACTSPAP
jgi:hypothetical protein